MNYIERERSPRRRYAIIAAVVIVHGAVLYALFGNPGRSSLPREGLIRVAIFPASKPPHKAGAAAARE